MSQIKADIEAVIGDPRLLNRGELFERILRSARRILESMGCDHAEEIIRAALEVYDLTAAIVDIPILPDPIEKLLEAELRRVLDRMLHELARRICGDISVPNPEPS